MKLQKCFGRICVVLVTLVLISIFGTSTMHAHSQWTHMKFLKYCGRIFVLLVMVVLRPIFGTSTAHIPTHEVSEVLWAYLWSDKYAGVKTNI